MLKLFSFDKGSGGGGGNTLNEDSNSTKRIVYSGFFRKRGESIRSWKRRKFFIIEYVLNDKETKYRLVLFETTI